MRLPTFSFLKSSRLKGWCRGVAGARPGPEPEAAAAPRSPTLNTDTHVLPAADASLVDISASWEASVEPELRMRVLGDMLVVPDFISTAEEESLLQELEPVFRRLRYEFDHWDNAIIGYRETERRAWSAPNEAVLARVRTAAFPPALPLLPATHVLDLAPAGYIKPHVDAVRFCGAVIAGLCLCSGAVMRLQHAEQPALRLDALLQRRALYVMKGSARYDFSHEVLRAEDSVFRGRAVPRRRRVALIARQAPRPGDAPSPPVVHSA